MNKKSADAAFLNAIDFSDMDYSYHIAKKMETFKTNQELGFRTAGSRAEFETGEFILSEMNKIGLRTVKDRIIVDGWEFKHARLRFQNVRGKWQTLTLSAYQTQFITGGEQEFEIVNVGKGTMDELAQIDVKGKLALVFINQRDEWWINYPAYSAHLSGAAAIIAVQDKGFGEINSGALNAQDICGPCNAPAFSMSKTDAKELLKCGLEFGKSLTVFFDADSRIYPDTETYNIVGSIPGTCDGILLVTAHYDSYFSGFQDDNTGVAMLLGMAKAVLESGYKPTNTLVFCALAAEEWGTIDSRYDWSAGAYAEFHDVHPDWIGKVVANINLELPSFSHNSCHYVRTVYEYKSYLKSLTKELPESVLHLYPKGIGVICPVQTWSDDFAISLAGIPSMVNEFKISSFMETHYHSQFDSDAYYDEKIYRLHHALYTRLLLCYDRLPLPPLDFGTRFKAMDETLDEPDVPAWAEGTFRKALSDARSAGKALYERIQAYNELSSQNSPPSALRKELLRIFKVCQDNFVSLDWYECAIFPFENTDRNICKLKETAWNLWAGDKKSALAALVEIDDNSYAEAFSREVTRYFTQKALCQPPSKAKWGKDRLKAGGHLDLYDLITALKGNQTADYAKEIGIVESLKANECKRLANILTQMTQTIENVTADILAVTQEITKLTECAFKQ